LHDGGTIDVGEAGNFLGEQLVPELPVQTMGQFRGNGAAAAAVLSLS